MDAEKLQIIIELLQQGDTKSAQKDLQDLQDKAEKATGKNEGGGLAEFKSMFMEVMEALAIVEGIKVSIEAFQELEQATTKLSGSLHSSGKFTDEYFESLKQLGETLQDSTHIDASKIFNVEATLVQFGALRSEMPDLTQKVLNLVAAGHDINQASQAIGAAVAGDFAPLERILKTTFPEGTTRAEKFAQSMDLLNQRFGGLAANSANGTGGLKEFSGALSTLEESVGEFFLTGVQPIVHVFSLALQELNASIKGIGDSIREAQGVDESESALQEQLIEQRTALDKIIEARRESGALTDAEAAKMMNLLRITADAATMYENLKKVRSAILTNTALPAEKTDLSRNYDPTEAKRQLELVQKNNAVNSAGAALLPYGGDTTQLAVFKQNITDLYDKVDQLQDTGLIKQQEADKYRTEFQDKYLLGLAQMGKAGKDVDEQLYASTVSYSDQQYLKISKEYADRKALINAYYDFQIERMNATGVEEDAINLRRDASLKRADKSMADDLSQTHQIIVKTGESAEQSFSSGLATAMVEFADNTKSASQAFSDFATSFLTSIAQMIMQQIIFNTVRAGLDAIGLGSAFAGAGAGAGAGAAGSAVAVDPAILAEGLAKGGQVYAANGVMMAAGGIGGIGEVSSPTYFSKFHTIAGEAGREVLTVLSHPSMVTYNGIRAQIGNAGGSRIAMMSASDFENLTAVRQPMQFADGGMAGNGGSTFPNFTSSGPTPGAAAPGGKIQIEISHSDASQAKIVQNSVTAAVATVTQHMTRNTPLSEATKRLVK